MVLEVPLLCLTDGTLFKVHFGIDVRRIGMDRVATKEPEIVTVSGLSQFWLPNGSR